MGKSVYAVFADPDEKIRGHDPERKAGVSKKLRSFRNRTMRHNKGSNCVTVR
jgi:hypothetical protein